MEDDQKGRRPKWKKVKMEDDKNGRRSKCKMNQMDDYQNESQNLRPTKIEDDQN